MSITQVLIRIVLAAALGGAIGIEREIHEHTAGFRTHILVAVGAAVFTLSSIQFGDDRIAAGIVTGIGFLGAGAILRYGVSVRGLTTAASLWTVAAVGLLAGQGFYSACLVATAVVIASLYALRYIEQKILYPRVGTPITVKVQFRNAGFAPLTVLVAALDQNHVQVMEMGVIQGENDSDTIRLSLKLPRSISPAKLNALVSELPDVRSVVSE
ncbi:MAG TPA: MgtC/SapB family protein [Thermoleophilia bacterium]